MRRMDMNRYLLCDCPVFFFFRVCREAVHVFESSDYDTLIVQLQCGFCFLKREISLSLNLSRAKHLRVACEFLSVL